MPNRRKFVGMITLSIGSLSGCINVDSGEESESSNNGDNSSTQNSTDSDTGNQTSDNDSESEDDAEEDSEKDAEDTLLEDYTQRVQGVREALDWITLDYSGAYIEFREAIEQSTDKCEELESADIEDDVTVEDLNELEQSLNTVKSVAFDDFGQIYRYHYDWDGFVSETMDTLRRHLRRSENQLFKDELRSARQELTDQYQHISDTYPNEVVDTIEPYERFEHQDGDRQDLFKGFIFEVGLRRQEAYIFTGAEDLLFGRMPLGYDLEEFEQVESLGDRKKPVNDEYEYVDADITLQEDSEWFLRPNSNDRTYHLTMTNYALLDEFPSQEYDTGEIRESNATVVDLNLATPIGVTIQTFESAELASQKLEEIKEQGTVDGTKKYHGIEYEQVFYIGEETYYGSFIQVEDVILTLDPSSIPWDIREYPYLTNPNESDEEDRYSSYSLEYISEGTFIDMSFETSEDN